MKQIKRFFMIWKRRTISHGLHRVVLEDVELPVMMIDTFWILLPKTMESLLAMTITETLLMKDLSLRKLLKKGY